MEGTYKNGAFVVHEHAALAVVAPKGTPYIKRPISHATRCTPHTTHAVRFSRGITDLSWS